jgi:transcription elongation factor Elf1
VKDMESYHAKKVEQKNPIPEQNQLPAFKSVTQKFLSSPESRKIECPNCGSVLDFSRGVMWQGPDTFTCSKCNHLLSIRLLQRALKDLGIE